MRSLPVLPKKSPLFGCGICYPSPGTIERIGSDWDWIWIDGQHGELAYQDILALVRACDMVQRPACVRIASHEYGEVGKALDMGVSGVIIPCVNTVEQAKQLVYAAKFPPLGGRSYGSRRIIDLYGRMFVEKANAEVLLIVQIESPRAIECVDEIAQIPGVDALFLGPDDIMLGRGMTMDTPRTPETLGSDMQAVVRACRRHKKKSVTVAVGPEMSAYAVQCGFDLIIGGVDVGFLDTGSKRAAAEMKSALRGAAPREPDAQPPALLGANHRHTSAQPATVTP